jgi:arsenate reductase (thioredoxin)
MVPHFFSGDDEHAACDHVPLVLFLCGANRARSKMGEAILRHEVGDQLQAASAGLRPATVDPMAIHVLEEVGIDARGLHSKSVDAFLHSENVDCAIMVCEEAEELCPRLFPFCYRVLHWPLPDPVRFAGSKEDRLDLFRRVRDDLRQRIRRWLDEKPFYLLRRQPVATLWRSVEPPREVVLK